LTDAHNCAPLVHNIDSAVKRATDLTSQLLAFSRKGKFVSEPVDVHRAAAEVVNVLNHSIDKKIAIVERMDATHSVTEADSSQLHNVLLNLALNARDAMPQGGTIEIRTKNLEIDPKRAPRHLAQLIAGHYIQISVSDTGEGMTKEVQRRIFEPFFTTKPPGEGTGLGLAAAYGTLKNHGGAIHVKSALGAGTTVYAYLPLSDREPKSAAADSDPASTLSHTARVLLVDDEAPVRDVVSTMLQSLGCQVAASGDGQQAIQHYRANAKETDLVILDMVMPSMSGRETFAALREIDPQVRALLASGYSIEGEAQMLVDEGVAGFIQKPYGRAKLGRAIARVLRHARDAG
jgi:CheY-like chemotaxis protein